MSVTTISGSLGLRVGDGRGVTSLSTKKASGPVATSNVPSIVANNNNSTNKMAVDNLSVTVPSQSVNPVGVKGAAGVGGSTNSTAPSVTTDSIQLSKAYGTIVLTLENVLLPQDKIIPTPSALDGLDHETEMDLRIAGCELISSSGILLKLPQVRNRNELLLNYYIFDVVIL